ncbi:protein PPP1R35 homolog [Stomoxys calcitrans]|uniref:protein PPP1R35 homolog n=1 Tax=Stomoxys calcitrans TaxID=35570 RepID=UPI0027E2A116|nr:protein PPP1R35 homolog [Stomoxys calcitrans]
MEKPRLYTTLRQLRQGKSIQNQKPPDVPEDVILPSETSKKLNFGETNKIFKNLLPINVNDSILPPQNVFRTQKVHKNMDPSLLPDLRDYLQPLPPFSHVIPEPELHLEFNYSRGFDVYKNL